MKFSNSYSILVFFIFVLLYYFLSPELIKKDTGKLLKNVEDVEVLGLVNSSKDKVFFSFLSKSHYSVFMKITVNFNGEVIIQIEDKIHNIVMKRNKIVQLIEVLRSDIIHISDEMIQMKSSKRFNGYPLSERIDGGLNYEFTISLGNSITSIEIPNLDKYFKEHNSFVEMKNLSRFLNLLLNMIPEEDLMFLDENKTQAKKRLLKIFGLRRE